MPLDTQNVTIALEPAGIAQLVFSPVLTPADGYLVLEREYPVTTDEDGLADIDLPCKEEGSIKWRVRIPRTNLGRETTETRTFFLSLGVAPVALASLIAAGGTADVSTIEYVDNAISVSETYTNLALEYGVVADDTTDNSAAIQAALDDVKANFGGAIVFPNGITKMIGETVTDFDNNRGAVRILGDGGNSIHPHRERPCGSGDWSLSVLF